MGSCVFPGSFDPVTCGHMDLIKRASVLFDSVTVAVMVNISKSGVIPFNDRVGILKKACRKIENVKVELWTGLLVDYMKMHPGSVILRGVRNAQEFEQEINAADINRRILPGTETFLIPASPEWTGVSSSMIRELASFGGNFKQFVPNSVFKDIQKHLKPLNAEK